MKNNINYEIALDMINGMPEEKKKALRKSLERNWILTSSYIMESGYMVIYNLNSAKNYNEANDFRLNLP